MPRYFLVLIFVVVLSGCGGSSDDALIKKQINLNQSAAEELAKVKDASGAKQLLTNYGKERQKMMQKITDMIKSVPKEKVESIIQRLNREVRPSQEKLDDALADFNKRMIEGKSFPQVVMETSMGPVKIELFDDLAPITVKNFLKYVDEQYFDGTIFHRVISDFMIQGGGFEPGSLKKEKKTGAPIENESYNGMINDRGTLAMARTSDPNSATAQFFINVKNNGFLNKIQAQDGYGYAVFGRVIDGMDVVDKIKEVETTTRGGHEKVPVQDVVIKSILRVEKKK
jgi:peptidyl-prolyl cis-trans isomerase B (cyclophilin B)